VHATYPIYVLLLFLIKKSFNDSRQTNYFVIYRTDLCQLFMVGRLYMINLKLVFNASRDVATVTSFVVSIGSVAGRRRLAAQRGGLTAGSAVHLVSTSVSVGELSDHTTNRNRY